MAVAGPFDPAGLLDCDPEVFYRIVERLAERAKGQGHKPVGGLEVMQQLAQQEATNGR